MEKLKLRLALLLSKFIFAMIKLFKMAGTTLVGFVLLRVFPDFLKIINKKMNGVKITVSGTNGKTTTSGLIAHLLKTDDNCVVNNLKGANLLVGITNSIAEAFVKHPEYLEKSPDYFVFETDEGHLQKLYPHIPCDYMVLTNLFDDQADRFGSIENVCKYIKNAISMNKNLKLVLNSDDPVTSNLAGDNPAIYYGIEEIEYCIDAQRFIKKSETYSCPICGKNLDYDKVFYAHQGHYRCTCGYARRNPDYSVKVKIYDEYSDIYIFHEGTTQILRLKFTELYNIYNAIAAIVTVSDLGFRDLQDKLDGFKSIFGRSITEIIDKHKTTIRLIKNPVGANIVMGTIDQRSDILLAFNDNTGDGHDVSWIWDIDFTPLKHTEGSIIVTGMRGKDAVLRLKYADVPMEKVKLIENINDAVNHIYKNAKGSIIILPNYTALYEIKKNERFERL